MRCDHSNTRYLLRPTFLYYGKSWKEFHRQSEIARLRFPQVTSLLNHVMNKTNLICLN